MVHMGREIEKDGRGGFEGGVERGRGEGELRGVEGREGEGGGGVS